MIAAFVFSLVLVGLSFADIIPVFLHLQSTVYGAPQESQEESDKAHDQGAKENQKSEDKREQ